MLRRLKRAVGIFMVTMVSYPARRQSLEWRALRCFNHPQHEDAANAVLELAAGSLDEAGYSAFLRANVKRRRNSGGFTPAGSARRL